MERNFHPHQTTRLENLRFGSDGARFDLEGQTVNLRTEADPASVASLRGFYHSALAGYQAREHPPREGWLSRIKSWIGRLFGRSQPGEVNSEPPVIAPIGPPPTAVATRAPVRRTAAPDREPPLPVEAGPPALRAAFADEAGVHVIWQESKGNKPGPDVELRYDLNSELAHRLQECYGHLGKLGYKVVGLDLMQVGTAEPRGRAPENTAEKPSQPVIDPGPKSAGAKETSAEKKEPTLIVRLHPMPMEQPGRALVSPVETEENMRVVVAPERMVRALHAAADPAKPAKERLTYLRCAVAKSGLKIVDIGLGEDKNQQPERWEEVSAWFARQTDIEPPAKKSRAAPPVSTSGPELSLNL